MKIGIFTAPFGTVSVDTLAERTASIGAEAIEIGLGAYSGPAQLDVDRLLADERSVRQCLHVLGNYGLTISALACHANPLHPNRDVAGAHDAALRRAIRLAPRLGVSVVTTFSGCPGDSDGARYPNWITYPWPADVLEALRWQWEQRAVPYWVELAELARSHEVRLAIEMHPGFLVYNPETALRLRRETAEVIGVNFDPSHLFWQGIDVSAAARALCRDGAIFHVHAKDTFMVRQNVAVNGVIDTKPHEQMPLRSWVFRTVGWGHDEGVWKELFTTLRTGGYDAVVSVEHEDSLMPADEGLARAVEYLRRVIPGAPAA